MDRRLRWTTIAGIGLLIVVSLATVASAETVTWTTATDWDNAQANDWGIVHESTGELPGAGTLTIGYPSQDTNGTALRALFPSTDDSLPITNTTGGSGCGANGGPTLNQEGFFNRGVVSYDGVDDFLDCETVNNFESGSWTVFAWIRPETFPGCCPNIVSQRDSSGSPTAMQFFVRDDEGDVLTSFNGNSGQVFSTAQIFLDTWHSVALVYDTNQAQETHFYRNGTLDSSADQQAGQATTAPFRIASSLNQDEFWDGKIGYVHVYTRPLSSAEIQGLHQAVHGGNLTTATKSFTEPVQPDLQNVDHDLNAGTITVTVTGSPGTASEERETVTLDGTTAYDLTWASSHDTYQIDTEIRLSDRTRSPPLLHGLELQADTEADDDGGGVTGTQTGNQSLVVNVNNTWTSDRTIHAWLVNGTGVPVAPNGSLKFAIARSDHGLVEYWNGTAFQSPPLFRDMTPESGTNETLWTVTPTQLPSASPYVVLVRGETNQTNTTQRTNLTAFENVGQERMIEIAGLQASGLIEIGVWGILFLFAMKFGLSGFAFVASAAAISPLLVETPVPYPGFRAFVVFAIVVMWLEYLARNNLLPTEGPENDEFNHSNRQGFDR